MCTAKCLVKMQLKCDSALVRPVSVLMVCFSFLARSGCCLLSNSLTD